jgi:hypothetical protein
MSDSESIPLAPIGGNFTVGEITLYGVSLVDTAKKSPTGRIVAKANLGIALQPLAAGLAVIAAYGYSYEGLCYRFEPSRVLVFPTDAVDGLDLAPGSNACGFEPPYQAWIVASADELLELAPTFGTVDKLIVDPRRSGKRPPNTYRSEMLLAHRGGGTRDA